MSIQKIKSFSVIGISIRTTNENGQSSKDIPALWGKFMHEGILEKIPNKIDNTVYCIYTDYEKDHTKPYTTILGCKVENLSNIPYAMIGKTRPADVSCCVETYGLIVMMPLLLVTPRKVKLTLKSPLPKLSGSFTTICDNPPKFGTSPMNSTGS